MIFKLGTTDINKTYLGSTEIKKVYQGSTLIYDKTGGVAKASISYIGTVSGPSDGSFNVSLGTASTDRLVIFVLASLSTNQAATVLTVNGVNATLVDTVNKVGGNFCNGSIFVQKIPTGTTATVTSDVSGNLQTAISTYICDCTENEAQAASAFVTAGQEGATTVTANLVASPDSFVIAARLVGNGTQQPISGVSTIDYSQDIRSNEWTVFGSTTSGASGAQSISVTDTVTNQMIIAASASLTAP